MTRNPVQETFEEYSQVTVTRGEAGHVMVVCNPATRKSEVVVEYLKNLRDDFAQVTEWSQQSTYGMVLRER